MFEPAEDLEAVPPPAYELTQEDYDRKTSQVIGSSVNDPTGLEEVWEEWDESAFEAAFEAAARENANGGGASSSSSTPIRPQFHPEKAPIVEEEPVVRPLRIAKKHQQTPSAHVYSKATEAYGTPPPAPDFDAQASTSDSLSPHPPANAFVSRSTSIMSIGRRTPPPAFEHMGPSLDGPDYEEMAEQQSRGAGNTMAAPRASRPLYDPQMRQRTQSVSPAPSHRQSLANGPQRVPQRPMTQYPPPQRRLPHNFDPMSAYSRPLHPTPSQSAHVKVDASAFYKYVCFHSN